MSKKTVVFKIPTLDAPHRVEAPTNTAAQIDEHTFSVTPHEPGASAVAAVSEPDRWVRGRNLDPGPRLAPAEIAKLLPVASAFNSVAIDLFAERSFSQVIALSLAVPPMLGWVWLAGAVRAYQRIWAN
jgi:hypothetical protein